MSAQPTYQRGDNLVGHSEGGMEPEKGPQDYGYLGRRRDSLAFPESGSSSWSERWARFKRLFVAMAWHNVETRTRLFLGIAFMVIGIIIGVFEKF